MKTIQKIRNIAIKKIQILGITLIILFFILFLNYSCRNTSEDKTVSKKQISIKEIERQNMQANLYIETNIK